MPIEKREVSILDIVKDERNRFTIDKRDFIWEVPRTRGVIYVAYKKVLGPRERGLYVLKLQIPGGALILIKHGHVDYNVFSNTWGFYKASPTNKMRASKAKVLKAWRISCQTALDGRLTSTKELLFWSAYDRYFSYRVGKTKFETGFDLTNKQCSHGIHCYASRDAAKNHEL